jgi:TM2 domain-containing membrane protein YozV
MDSVLPIIFMILFATAAILVVGGVIYLVTRLVKNKDTKDSKSLNITVRMLFKIYLYVISFISLAVSVIGGTMLIKAGASYAFGIPFSYTLYSANNAGTDVVKDPDIAVPDCYEGNTMTFGNKQVCFNEDTRKQELITGATFFISMLMIFGLHQFALKRMEKKSQTPWLKKIYTFVSLILYSIVGVVIIPTSIYQLATHLLYRVNDVTMYDAPGTAIGILIMTLPLWIFFLVKTTKMKDED